MTENTVDAAKPTMPASMPIPMQGTQLLFAAISVSLATFMNVLDMSIANVSIPAISGDLGVSPNQGTWVITSFAVSNAISVPLTGWLAQRFGQVRLFVASVVLFVLASLLCGMAPSIEFLIAFRILQGAVAGPMVPMSQSLLMGSFPREKAGIAMAIWSMTTLVAPITGPILGGWISDNYSWPWIFFINVPLGLGAAYATWKLYHKRETQIRKVPIDTIGLTLLVIWVGSLQLMLDKGRELDWFNSYFILGLGAIFVVCFVYFIIWEKHDAHPVVDLSLFKRRNFTAAVFLASLGYGVFFGNVVILPLWLQTQIGYTATDAGLVMAPVGLLALLITPIVGRNIQRVDARLFATFGFLMFGLVLWMRSHFTSNVDTATLMLPALLQGIAMAMFFTPLNLLAMTGLPPERFPAASGLSNFSRILFGGFGSSIATTAWDNRQSLHHAQLTEHMSIYDTPFNQSVSSLQQLGLTQEQAHGAIEHTLDVQAGTLGVDDIFWLSSVIFIMLIAFIWMTKPIHGAHAPGIDSGGH